MLIDDYQLRQTIGRYEQRAAQRTRNERLIKEKRYLEVDTPERVAKFLRRRGLATDIESRVTGTASSMAVSAEAMGLPPAEALERFLGTNDLMGVAFLETGLRVARTVARVWVNVASGRPAGYGTGFLVSPRLLMTNNHVLENAAIARNSLAEFDYQRRADGTVATTASFMFEPEAFFYTDRDLDYSVVAVRGASSDGRPLAEFGCNFLSEEEGKAIAPQWANIIQHPGGEPKQVSLRENQIVDVLPNFLHYKSDTARGSSGAAVFNDRWEIVGLHHSGVPDRTVDGRVRAVDGTIWRPEMGEDRINWIANEGVRISRIIAHLRGQLESDAHRALFNAMLTASTTPTGLTPRSDGGQTVTSSRVRPEAHAVQGPDGSVTWTIPLSVTVNLGGGMALPAVSAAAATSAGGPAPAAAAVLTPPPAPGDGRSPDEVLAAARKAFANRADVLGVRLGYCFKDGRITQERALVVTVRRKKSVADLKNSGAEELPTSFGGLRVQVSDPTIAELILAEKGIAAAEALALNVDSIAAEITYKPPANPGLKRVKERMKVNAHVGPDAGWLRLKDFLEGTQRSLTVGMYDFGARHIAKAIGTAGKRRGFRNMTLALQPGQSVGSGTKANDLTDQEAVDELKDALGAKFKNAWIKIGVVNGWVASSYHIKVAVRDGSAFWLSSGNWQSSNQPDADPLKKPWKRSWLTQYNREWHAIVEHAGLAAEFERYLQHDFANNTGVGPEAMILPDLLVPEEAFLPTALEKTTPFKYFEPLVETRIFDVQPLLTPDNYFDHALKLVESAQDELIVQNQTFNAPKPNHAKLRELLGAVLDRQKAGVDVRIVFRIISKPDARKNLEALQEFGFDMSKVKVQKNCHTKGFIVDRQRVLLGSQNLSEQGITLNRDASLLFEDEKLAKYFADIFEHDWTSLASDSIDIMPSGIELAPGPGGAPGGFEKISVEEYLESL
jgi:V8-like Glu-specific endopeptidase